MSHRDLHVLDAAERAAVLVNALIDRSRRRLLGVRHLRKSAMAVPLNIAERSGREHRADRDYKLTVARGEAEEVISCLRTNFRASRIVKREYEVLRDKYVVIVKMLKSLMNS